MNYLKTKTIKYLDEHADVISSLNVEEKTIEIIIGVIKKCFAQKCKLLICGNGGSAADAQHMAAEFVNRFKVERKGLPAIALNTDSSILTSIGNDRSFDDIFERQIDALGRPGDCLIVFSTSGNSKNIEKALSKATGRQMTTIAFLGKGGGAVKGMADIEVIIPSNNTPRIQEAHQLLYHIICEEVELD